MRIRGPEPSPVSLNTPQMVSNSPATRAALEQAEHEYLCKLKPSSQSWLRKRLRRPMNRDELLQLAEVLVLRLFQCGAMAGELLTSAAC